MRFLIVILILAYGLLYADANVTNDGNKSNKVIQKQIDLIQAEDLKKRDEALAKAEEIKQKLDEERLKNEETRILSLEVNKLLEEKGVIDKYLAVGNIWSTVYSNYETYQILDARLQAINDRIVLLEGKQKLTKKSKKALAQYIADYQTIKGKLAQLQEYKADPFKKLLTPGEIGKTPTVNNPLEIISAFSFQKHLINVREEYQSRYNSLDKMVSNLQQKTMILKKLILKSSTPDVAEAYSQELAEAKNKLTKYEQTLDIFKTSLDAFKQKITQVELNVKTSINKEIEKSIVTASIILFLLLFFIFVKYLVKKYMSENELFYGTNKALNFLFILIIILMLLFTYIEDVGNLTTILGFASAGIAIALKDWFMNLIGWIVILVSGSIHVGDRVKFFKNGIEYVGDVVDISMLRITMHEDVTLTTITLNKRAGRMIFIPNNYIFTDMIANYSHSGLKTVWDGIEFMITFDSNVAKTQSIVKEVTRKYSKGYTDMTRKQLNKLRSKYSMRNTAVEPRIFGFIDTYGVKISVWYLTNAFATLTLRSTISMEILARLQEEDDIFMAFPSQSLYMNKPAPRTPLNFDEASMMEEAMHHQKNPMGTRIK